MRIGICSYWFNRGQAVVARHLRTALEDLGHETFVLARPNRPNSPREGFIDRTDVWDQPGVTAASAWEIPARDYLDWASANGLELVFFDQNYGFEGIAALRGSGVRTIGRFVWEQFSPDDVEPVKQAFDVIYSLTQCERERYAALGIDTPYIPWGIHPELLAFSAAHPAAYPAAPGVVRASGSDHRSPSAPCEEAAGRVVYFYPGGFMTKRKPVKEVLAAFERVTGPGLRLVIKAQVERKQRLLERASRDDPRVEVVLEDLPTAEHLRLFASSDVCLAPSRWEGLGLHLYEALAFGIPVITNDNPPMNEVIRNGENGILVRGLRSGEASSGIPAFDPDVDELTRAIERLTDPDARATLAAGARAARERLSWERTTRGYAELIAAVS
jgi:1,2-diacylglycerol 3-alpha-glucosyltransferase